MIYGIGTDIVQISRMQSALERHGERFAEKILGVEELAVFRLRGAATELRGIRYLATRFAAKEAFSKAIGTGMQLPMSLSSMQTLNAPGGQPVVALSGALKGFMAQRGLTAQISISDESEYALAFVVVEKTN